jgi:hypothetical protein
MTERVERVREIPDQQFTKNEPLVVGVLRESALLFADLS